jgi:hypothetical protein
MSTPEPAGSHADLSHGTQTLAVIRDLFLLMRTASSHGPDHPLTRKAASTLAADTKEAAPPFSLQFVGKALFRDTKLLPMDLEAYLNAIDVGNALRNLEANELTVERVPEEGELLRFGIAMARGMAGPSDLLSVTRIDGMKWREIQNVAASDAELVDPGLFVLTQITLALAEAEQMPAGTGEPWPWVKGVSVIRRLERAVAADRAAAIRVIDLAPGEWDVARRAVSAAMDVILVLRSLAVSNATARATAHAVLILGLAGYRPRGGALLALAAEAALPGAMRAPVTSRSGVEPHRLRTSAILHGLAHPGIEGGPRVMPLVDLCYELGKARRAEAVPFDLTRVDLLAMASAQSGRRFDPEWVATLVSVCGVLPPGAFVKLSDGRIGSVIDVGEDGDPLRPRVLVDGRIVVPRDPVSLVSPAVVAAGG